MVYTPNMSRRIGMIAGGTGITPMLQVIKAIIRNRPRNGGNDTTEINLIFANVNPDDILLQKELDQLAAEDDKFSVYYVLNNPPEGWTGGVGFVTGDMIKVCLSCCGLIVSRRLRFSSFFLGTSSGTRQRYPHFPLWPSPYDHGYEEDHRGSGLRQGRSHQQAPRPGLCFLSSSKQSCGCQHTLDFQRYPNLFKTTIYTSVSKMRPGCSDLDTFVSSQGWWCVTGIIFYYCYYF